MPLLLALVTTLAASAASQPHLASQPPYIPRHGEVVSNRRLSEVLARDLDLPNQRKSVGSSSAAARATGSTGSNTSATNGTAENTTNHSSTSEPLPVPSPKNCIDPQYPHSAPCSQGRGNCTFNGCDCPDGWKGPFCEHPNCPMNCSGRGPCGPDGFCQCEAGYGGVACEKRVYACPFNCTYPEGGECGDLDVCHCNPGREGSGCEQTKSRQCPVGKGMGQCSGRGKCNPRTGTCACFTGYEGTACDRGCYRDCFSHGKCDPAAGTCACQATGDGMLLYTGANCEKAAEPCDLIDCGNGTCHVRNQIAKCQCKYGYQGDHCTEKESKSQNITDKYEYSSEFDDSKPAGTGFAKFGNWLTAAGIGMGTVVVAFLACRIYHKYQSVSQYHKIIGENGEQIQDDFYGL